MNERLHLIENHNIEQRAEWLEQQYDEFSARQDIVIIRTESHVTIDSEDREWFHLFVYYRNLEATR